MKQANMYRNKMKVVLDRFFCFQIRSNVFLIRCNGWTLWPTIFVHAFRSVYVLALKLVYGLHSSALNKILLMTLTV